LAFGSRRKTVADGIPAFPSFSLLVRSGRTFPPDEGGAEMDVLSAVHAGLLSSPAIPSVVATLGSPVALRNSPASDPFGWSWAPGGRFPYARSLVLRNTCDPVSFFRRLLLRVPFRRPFGASMESLGNRRRKNRTPRLVSRAGGSEP
jgi:hypothetical protein